MLMSITHNANWFKLEAIHVVQVVIHGNSCIAAVDCVGFKVGLSDFVLCGQSCIPTI